MHELLERFDAAFGRLRPGREGAPYGFFLLVVTALVTLAVWSILAAPATLSGPAGGEDFRSRLTAEVRALAGAPQPRGAESGPVWLWLALLVCCAGAMAIWTYLNFSEAKGEAEARPVAAMAGSAAASTPAAAQPGGSQPGSNAPQPPDWMRTALRLSSDGVVAIDADGRIVSANPAAENALGYERGRLAGRMASDVLPEVGATQDSLRRFAQVTAPAPASVVRWDGAVAELPVALHRVSERGNSGWVALFRAPEAAQQPQAAAPEFRTASLRALENQILLMTGHSELVQAAMAGDDASRADADAAFQAAARAAHLCLELLPAAEPARVRRVNLNRMLEPIEVQLRTVLGAECEVDASTDETSVEVMADPELLRRAVTGFALHGQSDGASARQVVLAVRGGRLDVRVTPRDAAHAAAPNPADLQPAVEWIAAQGGTVEMEEHSGAGIRFRLWFPPAAVPGNGEAEPGARATHAAD